MDAVVHAGVGGFQNESGALTLMQVGRLAQKKEAEGKTDERRLGAI
jgi:hypothetical protein